MVLVRVRAENECFTLKQFQELIEDLPAIVVKALRSQPDTSEDLTTEDIEMDVSTFGPWDRHRKEISITIFSEMSEDRSSREADISDSVMQILRSSGFSVSLFLSP